ncbi:MAG: copper-binding protein [Helicobacteraceae bacterium]|jgi:Cu(I)/Ag(I) efflux system protein CusF|nr:copper-binding protein [Helicobacteraceae bacterium]
MKTSLIFAAALALAPLSFASDHRDHRGADAPTPIATTGYVRAIDADGKRLTIEHDAIPALNWPSMTMRFAYENDETIQDITAGSKVKFDFIQKGRVSLIQNISTVPAEAE